MQSKKEIFFEIIRFLIVGLIATLVDYIIFYTCNLVVFKNLNERLNIVLSTAFSFLAGLLTNWFLQKFVFKYITKEEQKSKVVFLKFFLLALFGLFITEMIMLVSRPIHNDLSLSIFNIKFMFWKLFFKCLATGIVLIINYLGRKFFVFKRKKESLH